ncbi:hypothetical protein OROMI_017923 [Orobanche minor]
MDKSWIHADRMSKEYKEVLGVDIEIGKDRLVDEKQLMILRKKLQDIEIDGNSCSPWQYNGLICPNCKGGDSGEKSSSLNITPNGGAAEWICFRAKCLCRCNINLCKNEFSHESNRLELLPLQEYGELPTNNYLAKKGEFVGNSILPRKYCAWPLLDEPPTNLFSEGYFGLDIEGSTLVWLEQQI